jgi:hypothetical protein
LSIAASKEHGNDEVGRNEVRENSRQPKGDTSVKLKWRKEEADKADGKHTAQKIMATQ